MGEYPYFNRGINKLSASFLNRVTAALRLVEQYGKYFPELTRRERPERRAARERVYLVLTLIAHTEQTQGGRIVRWNYDYIEAIDNQTGGISMKNDGFQSAEGDEQWPRALNMYEVANTFDGSQGFFNNGMEMGQVPHADPTADIELLPLPLLTPAYLRVRIDTAGNRRAWLNVPNPSRLTCNETP